MANHTPYKSKYNCKNLLSHARKDHQNWSKLWEAKQPKASYDVIIIGGGGHGLATAYYLAKNHGITNIAVIEKGWLGGGSTGRNTSIIRSNYLWDESSHLYDFSLQLYETLSQELNFNTMVSQRGVLNLVHDLTEIRSSKRRIYANKLNGVDAEWLDATGVKKICPLLNVTPDVRYPILGATYQARGGIARHDAIAWGYARAAHSLGVDIIQQCEVTDIIVKGNQVTGVQTSKGLISADKVGMAVAAHSSHIAGMAGIKLPTQTHPLQAYVSEPVKPILNCVVMSNAVHVYLSQTDKGELVMGAGLDKYISYKMNGCFSVIEDQLAACVQLFPMFSKLRVMRTWAGLVDTNPDASPIIGKTPVDGLYINCGWGTGGFKATPGAGYVYAHTIANNEPHPLNRAFNYNRFTTGALIDEHGAAAVAH
ncbi:MAG: sarcosine oxidase subunit beta family protein [Gammaproteobacteria bacterium]|nr:sarcosine oxidase subunit beta family protein [Gammaproteobacteria bacterium]